MTDPTPSYPQTNPTDTMPPTRASHLSPNLLNNIFTSLTHPSRRWSLLRTLQSDNPCDLNGELRGTATFHPLRHGSAASSDRRDVVYREEGELPNTFGAGLGWTKKYIWRQGENGGISVWFVKVKPTVKRPQAQAQAQEEEDEADYLFHNFDFEGQDGAEVDNKESGFVSPPVPPLVPGSEDTSVIMARGNHLCINDMYRTAYAFRVRPESGEVVSWSSRHVVKGPKKNQDIVNLYRMEG